MFPPVEHLEWIDDRLETANYDFATSDLQREFVGVVPEGLRSLDDPPRDETLEHQIAREYGPGVEPENVLVTAGATHANFVATATAPGGDDAGRPGGPAVVVEEPSYEPLRASPAALGATVESFRRDPTRHRVVPRAVADAVTDETALVVTSNRHNPSGQLTPRETLAAVGAHARDHGAHLLVDEVYAPFELDGRTGRGTAFGGVTAAGLESTIVTNSLTKFFGYAPLRLGWLVGPVEFVDRARSAIRHVPGVAYPSRRLARRLFADRDDVVARSRERVRHSHALLADFVTSRTDLDGFVPPGSTMAFVSHASARGDDVVEAALDAGVLLVPGRFFDRPDGIRIALGKHPDEMEDGLAVLGDVLDALAADGTAG